MSRPSEQLAQDLARELEQAATIGLCVVAEFVVRGMGFDIARDVLIQVLRDYGDATRNRE